MKAAEDSRTPRPRGRSGVREPAPASWSAAVLCRFICMTLAPSVDELLSHRIADDIRIPFEFQFRQNTRAISADRFDAQRQVVGDFLDAFSNAEHAQDMIFAIGEALVGRSLRRVVKV